MADRLTHLSLFSGIGGLDLAAEWAGFETVGQCEWADYPTKVLEKHWPDVPRWRDIRTLTKESFYERTGLHTVDIISGGFPCQPFSVAGKQKGKEDNRYLWPEMLRVIRELAPAWVIGENVPGILSIAGRTVCEDLEREGYAVTVLNFEAAAVGAKHRRERVFFVANTQSGSVYTITNGGVDGNGQKIVKGWEAQHGHEPFGSRSNVADTSGERCEERRGEAETNGDFTKPEYYECGGQKNWDVEPNVGGTLDGFPGWLYQHTGGLNYCESRRAIEVLRYMWSRDEAEEIWQAVRGLDRIQQEEILFSIVCKYKKNSGLSWKQLEGKKAPKGTMRDMWRQLYAGSTSQRFEQGKQLAGKYTDTMREVPFSFTSWEDGVPRVASGIKNRVDRLKCLGNAVVPQQAYPIFAAIAEIERSRP